MSNLFLLGNVSPKAAKLILNCQIAQNFKCLGVGISQICAELLSEKCSLCVTEIFEMLDGQDLAGEVQRGRRFS